MLIMTKNQPENVRCMFGIGTDDSISFFVLNVFYDGMGLITMSTWKFPCTSFSCLPNSQDPMWTDFIQLSNHLTLEWSLKAFDLKYDEREN